MRRVMIPAALWALTAAAASAQVTGIVTSRSVVVQDLYDNLSLSQDVSDSTTQYSFPNGGSPYFQAIENYQVSADVTPTEISFANNATSQGFVAYTSTTTSVAVTYQNGGSTSVTPTLRSTILPGGFGFYMDDPVGNPTLNGTSVGDVNQTPQSRAATFNTISGFVNAGPGDSEGYASFSFQVLNGDTVLKSFSASVALYVQPAQPYGVNFNVVASAPPALNGFGLVTPAGSNSAVGYQWNTTDVDIPLGVTLAPGESGTLTYLTTVTTSTDIQNANNCDVANACPQLLAYAGFGDPIGKSGGNGGDSLIADPYFPTFQLGLPTFDPTTGVVGGPPLMGVGPSLSLPGVEAAPYVAIPASVLSPAPEPRTWALLITGVTFVGAALRRRRRAAESGLVSAVGP